MLNLRIFFYGAAPKEQELQQIEALGKLCGYFRGLLGSDGHKRAWGAQQRGERCCPILPHQWGRSPLHGDAAENWPHRDLG